jgi:hypothetical protein
MMLVARDAISAVAEAPALPLRHSPSVVPTRSPCPIHKVLLTHALYLKRS